MIRSLRSSRSFRERAKRRQLFFTFLHRHLIFHFRTFRRFAMSPRGSFWTAFSRHRLKVRRARSLCLRTRQASFWDFSLSVFPKNDLMSLPVGGLSNRLA